MVKTMKLYRRDIRQGAKTSRHLGLAYYDFELAVAYYYPIPFNFIVRYCKTIQIFWDRFRCKPSWIDNQVIAAILKEKGE